MSIARGEFSLFGPSRRAIKAVLSFEFVVVRVFNRTLSVDRFICKPIDVVQASMYIFEEKVQIDVDDDR